MVRLNAILCGFPLTCLFAVGLGPVFAADGAQTSSLPALADELAQRVFQSADLNHNHVLNRNEFAEAHEMLLNEVAALGRQGVIGKPKKPTKDKQGDKALPGSQVNADKLARSNKVTPAEFTFLAHAVLDKADEQWREMRATAEAQRKAYNAQRNAMRRVRGRGVYPLPY
jgi:hypothetical protein